MHQATSSARRGPSRSHSSRTFPRDAFAPGWRSLAAAAAFAALLTGGARVATALSVTTYDGPGTPSVVNDTAPPPADDPGWANSPSNVSAVYLGDQWVVTANHTKSDTELDDNFFIDLPGGSYRVVPGSQVVLSNPSFFDANGNGFANGFGNNSETLSPLSDVKLFRIDTEATTGLTPEQMDASVRSIGIAASTPTVGTEVTAISRGARRSINGSNPVNGLRYFDSSFEATSNPSAPYAGFFGSTERLKLWGTNRVAAASGVSGMVDDGLRGIVRVQGLNDSIGLVTRFDAAVDNFGNPIAGSTATDDEFQGGAGDSGGGVFFREGDDWVLGGVFHAIYLLSGQPDNGHPLFGQYTAFTDLSQPHYADQIATLRESELYSVMGDIDLDGQVTGSVVNGLPTGDLKALVDGWMYQQASGDVLSWKQGDLNQDGFTDISDFVLLREALGGEISVSSFALLVGGAGIPEPSSLALLAAWAPLAIMRRRR